MKVSLLCGKSCLLIGCRCTSVPHKLTPVGSGDVGDGCIVHVGPHNPNRFIEVIGLIVHKVNTHSNWTLLLHTPSVQHPQALNGLQGRPRPEPGGYIRPPPCFCRGLALGAYLYCAGLALPLCNLLGMCCSYATLGPALPPLT
ncbi:predicted protein [Brucella abortus bv. 6 str. 870]|nr:predicted protein [Brucella abortus bv. 6 str. 870]